MRRCRPHDLLQVDRLDGRVHHDAPAWVRPVLQGTSWVVVLPGSSATDGYTVGVRGRHRDQRYAMPVPDRCIVDTITPEDIAGVRAWPTRNVCALQVFREIRAPLNQLGLAWGPIGSVGFEIATGLAAANPESDLNLILRVPELDQRLLRRLVELQDRYLTDLAAPVDCQVETPSTTISLTDLLSGRALANMVGG